MRYLLSLLTFVLTAGCQFIKPKEEQAVLYLPKISTMCACCGGWVVRVGSANYRTHSDIPDTYSKMDSTDVLIRYQKDDSPCGKAMSDLISLRSLRKR